MALTAFETAEQRLPCHVDQTAAADNSKAVAAAAAEQAVPLQEADHGGAGADQRPADRDDIWNMIQSQSQKPAAAPRQAPYVHAAPVRRGSSSLLTQKSLEVCTESLGSETGSDGFSDADRSCPGSDDDADCEDGGATGVAAAGAAPARAFPPPLPSLARRTVGSLQMRQHRRDGRLVVEAVPVLSNTLFRAQRRGGRLLLSFADTAAPAADEEKNTVDQEPDQQEEAEEETEEEEVQVVDRGTVVEVKVSTQPQAHNSGPRVHRSSLVINKFVGAEPVNGPEINDAGAAPPNKPSPLSATAPLPEDYGTTAPPGEGKVLMTTRQRRSKQEVLNHMRRCGQLSGRLFIWEPRVATSS
ncbi:uncharacterized protein [Lolium perenne]|uniref:uncharacterized protein n=1 Tax=Lolium perenne TaxID=4522 RepID=UPI0021EB0F12|nr:protein FAF-like, chloroplastic [Lolium perenne]